MRAWGLEFWCWGFGFIMRVTEFRVSGIGQLATMMKGLGFGVWGLGFGVRAPTSSAPKRSTTSEGASTIAKFVRETCRRLRDYG